MQFKQLESHWIILSDRNLDYLSALPNRIDKTLTSILTDAWAHAQVYCWLVQGFLGRSKIYATRCWRTSISKIIMRNYEKKNSCHLIILTQNYRIRQNFWGGKLSWKQISIAIRGKIFAVTVAIIVLKFLHKSIRGENIRGWQRNRENRECFPPRKFCRIRYSGYYLNYLHLYMHDDVNYFWSSVLIIL